MSLKEQLWLMEVRFQKIRWPRTGLELVKTGGGKK
jgi:hypothetical protein